MMSDMGARTPTIYLTIQSKTAKAAARARLRAFHLTGEILPAGRVELESLRPSRRAGTSLRNSDQSARQSRAPLDRLPSARRFGSK
jgi:hypothetical protein